MKNTIDKTWEIHVYRKQQSLVTMLKKNHSEHIFREVYSQAILVKSGQQKMFLMENDVILNDKTDIW
jgi:hypothetical protein